MSGNGGTSAEVVVNAGGKLTPGDGIGTLTLNDGLVPTASMIWGDVLWAGTADHLDVLGHFHGDRDSSHTDWLVSGAGFRDDDFDEVMDALAEFQLQRR